MNKKYFIKYTSNAIVWPKKSAIFVLIALCFVFNYNYYDQLFAFTDALKPIKR